MDDALHIALRRQSQGTHRHTLRGGGPQTVEILLDETPDTSEEAVSPLHAALGPVKVLFGRGGKEDKEARRIRTIFLDYLVGVDDVADRL